jgi:hypothetical protein
MEAGEPIKAFTLTTVEAEILSRARRLRPEDRLRLVEILREMTGQPATQGRKGGDRPDAQRGASRS